MNGMICDIGVSKYRKWHGVNDCVSADKTCAHQCVWLIIGTYLFKQILIWWYIYINSVGKREINTRYSHQVLFVLNNATSHINYYYSVTCTLPFLTINFLLSTLSMVHIFEYTIWHVIWLILTDLDQESIHSWKTVRIPRPAKLFIWKSASETRHIHTKTKHIITS